MSKLINAERILRLTLGAMYLYSGIDIVRHPDDWSSYVEALPNFILSPIVSIGGVENFLLIHGIGEILLGAIFLIWFMPRLVVMIAALLSAIEFAAILFLIGVDTITFRDIGLLGSSLALFVLTKK